MERDILLLGNQQLYEISEPIRKEDIEETKKLVADLHDTIIAFQKKYGVGRAIAAPQIGAKKRMVYMYINGESTVFINPVLEGVGDEMIEVMDDCMSFPNLLVKVMRHKKLKITYKDMDFNDCESIFEDDLSELLQHECDHLDGILATMRAIDNKSYFIKQ